jgi:acetyl-CoA carboxylase carboxyltransferase component
MEEIEKKINELSEKKKHIMARGGPEVTKRFIRDKGMLTARERIERLLDPGSFIEMDILVTHHCTEFGMENREIPADGVIEKLNTTHDDFEGKC